MWKRLALVPFQILLALLVVELGLQLASVVARRIAQGELPTSWVAGTVRVLCIGDSNTYGLYLERDEAYPAQLARVWNESIGSPALKVLNLGIPGTNSSRLVRDFSRLLEVFAPDVAIVLVGVNDFWTQPFPLDEAGEAGGPGSLRRHSRIWRTIILLMRGFDARELDIKSGHDHRERKLVPSPEARAQIKGGGYRVLYGDEEFEMTFLRGKPGLFGDRESLQRNLRTLAERAEAHGTRLFFMSYPARQNFYGVANPTIRRVAVLTGTGFIDLTERFRPLCPELLCPEYLFEDGHPNAEGYRIVAEAIVERLAGEAARGHTP
jgi:lysophospholipase L1-like esterase